MGDYQPIHIDFDHLDEGVPPPYTPEDTSDPVQARPPSPAPSYRSVHTSLDDAAVAIPQHRLRTTLREPRPPPRSSPSPSRSRIWGRLGGTNRSAREAKRLEECCERGSYEDWMTVMSQLRDAESGTYPLGTYGMMLRRAITLHDDHEGHERDNARCQAVKAILAVMDGPPAAVHLVEALAHSRNEEIIDQLILAGIDVNHYHTTSRIHPIKFALESPRQNARYVEKLVRARANIRLAYQAPDTALHFVVKNWSGGNGAYLIDLLVAAGESTESRDEHGMRPLDYALSHEDHHIRDALLESGAEIDHAVLYAVGQRDNTLFWQLIERNSDAINCRDDAGNSLFYSLVDSTARTLTTDKLIAQGVDLRTMGPGNSTVFHQIARHQAWTRAQAMFELDPAQLPDLNTIDDGGNTALHLIYHNVSDSEVWIRFVERFLQWKPDVNIRDASLRTPLHLAVQNKTAVCTVSALIEAGARAGVRDEGGKTPLHYATCCMAKTLLLDAGATVFVVDKQGDVPRACRVEITAADRSVSSTRVCRPHAHCRECKSNLARTTVTRSVPSAV